MNNSEVCLMEGRRKEKVMLDLCSVCWQMSASAHPYGCFHYLEPQLDLFCGCKKRIAVKVQHCCGQRSRRETQGLSWPLKDTVSRGGRIKRESFRSINFFHLVSPKDFRVSLQTFLWCTTCSHKNKMSLLSGKNAKKKN